MRGDLLSNELDGDNIYEPIYYKNPTLEFAFSHTDSYGDSYYSFVNGTYTTEGGTHLSAFREGILKGINEFSSKKFINKDVRDGLVGTLAVKIKEPVFESQTKNKLGNTEVRGQVEALVKLGDHLYLNEQLEAAVATWQAALILKPDDEAVAPSKAAYPEKAGELLESAIANTRWRQRDCKANSLVATR